MCDTIIGAPRSFVEFCAANGKLVTRAVIVYERQSVTTHLVRFADCSTDVLSI